MEKPSDKMLAALNVRIATLMGWREEADADMWKNPHGIRVGSRRRCEEAERQRDEARKAADEIDFRGRDLAERCYRLESALRHLIRRAQPQGATMNGRGGFLLLASDLDAAREALAQPAHASGEADEAQLQRLWERGAKAWAEPVEAQIKNEGREA